MDFKGPAVAAAKGVRVVTCTKLKGTGRISYMFLITANTPDKWMAEGFTDIYGILLCSRKSADHFDPFAWAAVQRGELPPETKFVGDDGVRRWNLNLFNSQGFVMATGWDEGGKDEFGETLKNFPERCAILMLRENYDAFEKGCKAAGFDVTALHFDGELSTG